jgi:serine/threonine protein kinase/GAF domain-containing protein
MGEVYLARDTRLDRNVALKILPAELAKNRERLQRFVQEAKAAAGLNHPNIAQIYDIGQIGESPSAAETMHFIAMEFVTGQTLRQHIKGTAMDLNEVLDISIQIAKAFSAAHAAGVVHRDIKPENIMLREDGIVKVLDFGLAKLTEPSVSPMDPETQTTRLALTEPGSVLGTVSYMSPEQARSQGIDPRADVFSLGVVIFEMLAGSLPFPGDNKADVLVALMQNEPQSLEDIRADIPRELQEMVSKALRKDKDERYQTVELLLNDLITLKQELDFSEKLKARSISSEAPHNQFLGLFNQMLETERSEIGATSLTFYVRDPIWPEELRLVAMPGVQLKEPMHGFSFPPHLKRVVAEGGLEIFSSDSRSQQELREDAEWSLDKIEPEKRFLFGDFVERERIKSSARLTQKRNDRTEAVLFVNFAETTVFDEPLKKKLRDLLTRCVKDIDPLRDELRASETDDLIQAIRMFPPSFEGSTQLYEWDKPLGDLQSVLGVALAALELEPGTAFGTVHLYDRQSQTLRLEARGGDIDIDLDRAESQSVASGQGIISWVAIRRKALLIADLESSAFAKIHIAISIDKRVRSEVAIPIFAGEELLGVLNLESLQPNAFRPMSVRSLWFAVNRAAVAQRLSNINARIKQLLEGLFDLCGEIVHKGTGSFSLDRLTDLAVAELEAARSGIWRYDEQADKFELAGITPADFKPDPPSADGWSKTIRHLGWPVWISRKEQGDEFESRYWNGESWAQPPPDVRPPTRINPSVGDHVKSLLGIPIKGRHQSIGIAWLEYERDQETPPTVELMKLASGFANYAGLVIEFSQVDLVDKDAVQSIGDELSKHLLASGPLKLERFDRIEGYARSEPFPNSRIGGDFYAARVIDEQTAGVLVGDGRGHAVTGALNMLPMLTVFEAFWSDSRSATHIMDKLKNISIRLGVEGTATYCIFSVIEDKLWLSGTSAGHPPIVIITKEEAKAFPRQGPARGDMLGVPLLGAPPAEDHINLSEGDLVIIYTDGLDLNIGEIAEVGLKYKQEEPKTIADAVFSKARDKNKSGPLVDDATVLVIRAK